MANTLYSAGPYDTINFVAQAAKRIASAVSLPGPTENSLFPLTNIYDGDPASVTRYSGVFATHNLVVDLLYNKNPSFTDWSGSTPEGWDNVSIGTGSIEEENSLVNSAPASVQLNSSSAGVNEGRVRQIVKVVAGNPYIVPISLRGDGTNTTSAYVRNLQTGMWLNSSNAWVASKTATFTRSTATFSSVTRTPTIESTATCGTGIVNLELRVELPNGTGYADDFAIWPQWNFGAIFGHEITQESTVVLQSDDNSGFSSATTVFTYTAPRRKPSFYGSFSNVGERFARLQIVHPSVGPGGVAENAIGEFFIGYMKTLTRGIANPLRNSPVVDLIGGGYGKPFSVQEYESAVYSTEIPHVTKDEYDDLILDVGRAGKWGARTTILVPDNTLSDVHIGTWSLNETRVDSKFSLSGEFTEYKYTPRVK